VEQYDDALRLPFDPGHRAEPATDDADHDVADLSAGSAEAADAQAETRARGRSRWWDRAAVALVFAGIYALLLFLYRPQLLLSLTTTSGGDMGAHHYPAQYLIEYLLPHLKMTGWTQQWYAGMPMFTFYLPLPFFLIAVADLVVPYQVAFKLVTVLGVFALPVVAWAYARLFRLRPPAPALAAACALYFLLIESFSIYGANILSTLAGEFGFSISFALTFLFLGTLHRGMERPRLDWLFALNCLLLGAVVLSHIVTVIMAVVLAPSLVVLHRRGRSVGYMLGVFVVAMFLSAFWSFPFVDKIGWSAHMSWDQLRTFNDLMPLAVRPLAAVGILGMAYAVSKRDLKMVPAFWLTLVTVAMFWLLPDGRLWNGRILPFFYFSVMLWAAYGAAWLVRPFMVMTRDLLGLPLRVGWRVYAPVLAVVLIVASAAGPRVAGQWIQWNYSGYEAKAPWPQYQEINQFLDSLDPGRVMWEHNPDLNKFGTPRIFELIPYWTDQPTMEGTLMESAFTAPYHFVNQAELSQQPSKAIIGVDYPNTKNIADGITHLQFMNIPYMIASSPEVTADLKADPRADLLKTVDIVNIFRIAGAQGYVRVAPNQPVRVKTDDWRSTIVPWYRDVKNLDTPVIWDRGQEGIEQFPEITEAQAASPPAVPLPESGRVLSEKLEPERITFETTAIGQPHWIKVSYFPNWQVEGADGPYVASPSFMVVVPRERTVTLTYGRTASNTVGQLATLAGWVIVAAVLVLWWRGRRRSRQEMAVIPDEEPSEGLASPGRTPGDRPAE